MPKTSSQQINIIKNPTQLTAKSIISTTISATTKSTITTMSTQITSIINLSNLTSTTTRTTTTIDRGIPCDNVSESHQLNASQNPCEKVRCNVIYRGSGGRLGNRMFMYASAYGLARTQNCRLYVAPPILTELSANFQMIPIDSKMYLSDEDYSKLYNIEIKSTTCTFQHELLRPNAFKNIELGGYWQSYLHFDAFREEIREIFTGRKDTLERVANYFNYITQPFCPTCLPLPNTTQKELRQAFRTRYNITWVGIHIRRLDFHGIGYASDTNYIYRAMTYFRRRYHDQRVRFLMASDDKTYCHEVFGKNRFKKVFILPHDFSQADDLIALTLCHHSIVTGGTYGFWSAYLAGGDVLHDIKYQAVCARADYYPPWFVVVGPTIEKIHKVK
ncbi:unnamed protein product [Adineta steineri]|uniref:L-Fucosyltransferase n=1 Tax=Adineta steineri TaxID=433720 RepID=A0A818T458_9BILA|nr:unnamed protein product [Adineta steineri]CAF3672134.1 unnamed protein product [Adineta steineri]